MKVCSNCGEENPDRFRLCGFCGTPFAAADAPPEVRKTVTVVFSDLVGSTSLGESMDSESLREILHRYFEAMQSVLESHGGAVEKFIGDAIMAVFGLPRLREDDAVRAVRAAVEMQAALVALNVELQEGWGVVLANRTGVNTGEVVAGDVTTGQRLVTGDTVNVAARLEQTAGAGEVLLGELTYRLVRDAVEVDPVEPLELKGKAEPVPAYRVRALVQPSAPVERNQGPLVGRERELGLLLESFSDAVAAGGCRLATVFGSPGMGKSRLVEELVARVGRASAVVRGRCLSHGRGITFWPIVEIVRKAAGILEEDPPEVARAKIAALAPDDAVARRIASAVGLSSEEFPVDETFWGVRKLLEEMASTRPLVVVFEDIHWAESTMLDLIEHVLGLAERPIFLVSLARHELLDIRPTWEQLAGSAIVSLEPLSQEDAARVAENLLGNAELDTEVRARIVEAAEGNPLFVEQMLSMMVDEGLLQLEGDRWTATADLEEVAVPPTIQALLAARLDLLGPEERAIIEAASVAGLVFPEDALRELVSSEIAGALDAHMRSLCRKHLIQTGVESIGGGAHYRFAHALVREAAYQGMLKRTRAMLHERFVGWADRVNSDRDRAVEFEEILGYHLEQAHKNLSELGPLDEHGLELGRNAAQRLSSAGRRAFARSDMPAAANLLRRAATILPERDPSRLELIPDLGEALLEVGEFPWAELFLEEAIESQADGDSLVPPLAELLLLRLKAQAGSAERWSERLVEEASGMLEQSGAEHGDATLATIWRLLAWAHGTSGRYGLATQAAERAMEHARSANDARQIRLAAVLYALAALHGPTPVPEAIERCERIASEAQGDRRTQGLVTSILAALLGMRGDFDRARRLSAEARALLTELGPTVAGASTSLEAARVESLAGDLPAAEGALRRDYEALTALGERYILSTVAGELARVLYAQGRLDEAEGCSRHAQDLADADDVASATLWRTVQAKVLAHKGNRDAALILIGEAVDLLKRTDSVVAQAETLVDLAEVLRVTGQPKDADDVLGDAVALFEAKGNLAAAEALRAPAAAG
ncbi:MAG TPA: adenylate/guanylate cyclase domain-containing protein [Gaiellaceae bacterium]|nr:adenylate/guanylate cyclase domain-containing protein [Gaiellaceae bacterium]HEX5468449.1 adenylate/guanylate cyclase domain-containing protein [Gaiellaceae bacterium]